jgi:hypothetical protein
MNWPVLSVSTGNNENNLKIVPRDTMKINWPEQPGELRPLIMTLAFVSLFTLASMAADRNPSVTIKSRRNFEIVVDGRNYNNDNNIRIDKMRRGMHTIKVYERSRGFFNNRLKLVSSKTFFVRNEDLRITVNAYGFVDVDEVGNGRGRDRDYNDRDRDWDRRDNDRDRDRDWDNNRNRDRDWDNRRY